MNETKVDRGKTWLRLEIQKGSKNPTAPILFGGAA